MILTHPRFLHWLGSVGEPPLDWDRMTFGADIVGSTAVPTNLGAGTNETRLFMDPPSRWVPWDHRAVGRQVLRQRRR